MKQITVTITFCVHDTEPFAKKFGGEWDGESLADKAREDAQALFRSGVYRLATRNDDGDADVRVTASYDNPPLRWNSHTRADGFWCRWSHVSAPKDTGPTCPAECPESAIEARE